MTSGLPDLSAVPRREVGAERWDALVDASDAAWLLHRYAYSEALATWPELTDESFALVAPDGSLAAIFPLQSSSHAHLRGAMTFADLRSQGGPAAGPETDPERRSAVLRMAVARARELAAERRGVELEVLLPALAPALRGDAAPAVNPLIDLGFADDPAHTWMVDLRGGEEAAWEGMQGRARTAVRKARKNGVTVRPAQGAGDLAAYYDLHQVTYARTGVRPHPPEYFELLWDSFGSAGELFVLFAEHEGEVVAAQTFATYKGAGWYWTSAASERGTRLAAPNLLQWEAMRRLVAAGDEWYETGMAAPADADAKARAISDFKRSMGGVAVPMWSGRIDTSSPAWRGLTALRGLRQKVRR
jgi:hypothetical protein